jgi:hypothetical protein
MKFSKIRISKDGEVELETAAERAHGKRNTNDVGTNPLKSFVDAVAAFRAYFLDIVPALKEEKDNVRITTISLGEKDGLRSLQVSGSLIIEKCNDAVISMTTPRVSEKSGKADDDGEDDAGFHLSKGVLKLIANVETEAERYFNGETAQTNLFASTSENSKAVDQKMAEAEVKSTRTPRGSSKVAGTIGTSPVVQ